MQFIYLFEGIVLGFLLATPVGPIGILAVRHTLAYGRRHGLVVGLGGASADVVYATIAAFGVRLISIYVADHQQLLRIAGGVILLVVGLYTFRSMPGTSTKSGSLLLHTKVYISTFLLAITNPSTLIGFATVFTMLGVKRILPEHSDIAALVVGIFLGSFLWFFVLTGLARRFKEKLTNEGLVRVNRIAGSLLILLGTLVFLGGVGVF
jgi:threonine/homoserine/homoserine lactone efflux protein